MIFRHAEHHLKEWYRSRRRKPRVLRGGAASGQVYAGAAVRGK